MKIFVLIDLGVFFLFVEFFLRFEKSMIGFGHIDLGSKIKLDIFLKSILFLNLNKVYDL